MDRHEKGERGEIKSADVLCFSASPFRCTLCPPSNFFSNFPFLIGDLYAGLVLVPPGFLRSDWIQHSINRCICISLIGLLRYLNAMLSLSSHPQSARPLPARHLFLHTAAHSPPSTSLFPLPYAPFSFLTTHPFCQRLIGLEMIWFILDVNAVIMLFFEKKRKKHHPPHALKPNLK